MSNLQSSGQMCYLVKQSSREIIIPKIRRRLSTLPTPKYRNNRKTASPSAEMSPNLELAKIVESKNKSKKKASIKNTAIAPVVRGSTKQISRDKSIVRSTITNIVGKKFFLRFNIFFLLLFKLFSRFFILGICDARITYCQVYCRLLIIVC